MALDRAEYTMNIFAIAHHQEDLAVLIVLRLVGPSITVINVAPGSCHHQDATLRGEYLVDQLIVISQGVKEQLFFGEIKVFADIRPNGQLFVNHQLLLNETQLLGCGGRLTGADRLNLDALADIEVQGLNALNQLGDI
ncbi:hypothetical protein D3C85_834730 [compost metagenome]